MGGTNLTLTSFTGSPIKIPSNGGVLALPLRTTNLTRSSTSMPLAVVCGWWRVLRASEEFCWAASTDTPGKRTPSTRPQSKRFSRNVPEDFVIFLFSWVLMSMRFRFGTSVPMTHFNLVAAEQILKSLSNIACSLAFIRSRLKRRSGMPPLTFRAMRNVRADKST